MKWMAWAVAAALLAGTCFVWAALRWTYSDGERLGYLQSLRQEGRVCGTWEGELKMLTANDRFKFTVRDQGLASGLGTLVGQRVILHYQQHRGVPTSCFGETQYVVVGARRASS
jgi:hypothetical protein